MITSFKTPLVLNENPTACPDCGGGSVASVLRDGGSRVYCTACQRVQWPNPRHDRGKRLYERLRTEKCGADRVKGQILEAIRDYEGYTPDERAGVTEESETRRLVLALRAIVDARTESDSR